MVDAGEREEAGEAMSEANAVVIGEEPRLITGLTERQVEAVYTVMRLLRDDMRPSTAPAQILCAGCGRIREGRGSVSYGPNLLCNGCATDYELLRGARTVSDVEEFLQRPRPAGRERHGA